MNGKQLKNSILQWAIQGKLVEQNPNDEPASKLLERIASSRCHSEPKAKNPLKKKSKCESSRQSAVRQHIFREGSSWYEESVDSKGLSADRRDITEEIPFEIPENWAWCRLVSVCDYLHRGKSPSYSEKKILPVMAQKCNQWDRIYTEKCLFADPKTIEKYLPEHFLKVGDVLINSTGGGTVGRTGFVDDYVFAEYEKFVADSHVTVVRANANMYSKYLYYFLITPLIQKGIEERCSGSTNQIELGTETIKNYLIPLPPLAEQKRIVKKLEQILPLVDEYGAAQDQLDKLNKELPDALKKSILQQAIQGKLVEQNPNDEPASKLLERIASSRSHSGVPSLCHSEPKAKNPLKKKSKCESSRQPAVRQRIFREGSTWYEEYVDPKGLSTDRRDITEEIPFDIPESWAWCRLSELGDFVRGSGIKRDETTSIGFPCVRYGEMYTTYKIKFEETKSFTSKKIFDNCKKAQQNDILMALTGENKWDIALAALYQGENEIALGGDLCKFSPIEVYPLFLVYLINSPYGIEYKRLTSTGDIIVHTSTTKLGNVLIPLPLLAEQKRIVAKLEQLFKAL